MVRAEEARRVLEAGALVRWTARVLLTNLGRNQDALAELLEAGDATMQAATEGIGPLAPPARIVSVQPADDATALDLLAEAVDFAGGPADRPDVKPRRRVHHPQNGRQLLDAFAATTAASTAVANVLESLAFPHGEHTSLPQDGATDWDFLRAALEQLDVLQTEPQLRGLILTGRPCAAAPPAWAVAWDGPDPYRHVNDVANRTVKFAAGDGHEQVAFGPAELGGVALFPRGPLVGRRRLGRTASGALWKEWGARDLPLFTEKERLIVRIEDRFYETHTRRTAWDTHYFTVAPGRRLLAPPARPAAWVGLGLAGAWQDGWVEARLPGFEAEDRGDAVHARLLTPYTGKSGGRGLHLVPEKDTPVLLGWSGRFADPVVVLGNVRTRGVELAAPSMWLEFPAAFRFHDLEVRIDGEGKVAVQKDWRVAAKGEAEIRAEKPLALHGDGASARLKDGVFRTGGGR
jgi:hypothetical protein